MRTIKLGNHGPDVAAWQTFLRGGQIDADGNCTVALGDSILSDGDFGPITDKNTKAWQVAHNLKADGVVGSDTWTIAVKESFPTDAVPVTTDTTPDSDVDPDHAEPSQSVPGTDKTTAAWPTRPDWAKPLVSQADREAVLGVLTYVAAPTASNPEAVHITNDFADKNIAKFSIPLLSKNPISMHKLAGPQFQAWMQAIQAKGLSNQVIGFAGCWVPRFVRGSKTRLSNHSWGSAIDIAVPYNGRGRVPALVGQKGCVREIADMCYDFGLFWGGHYKGAPLDGMHFELRAVLTADQIKTALAKYGVNA